jgi:hypothetical protein
MSLILTFAKFAQNTSTPPAAVLQCARTATLHATEVVPAASHVAHTTSEVNGHATAPAVAYTNAQAASVANRMAFDISGNGVLDQVDLGNHHAMPLLRSQKGFSINRFSRIYEKTTPV